MENLRYDDEQLEIRIALVLESIEVLHGSLVSLLNDYLHMTCGCLGVCRCQYLTNSATNYFLVHHNSPISLHWKAQSSHRQKSILRTLTNFTIWKGIRNRRNEPFFCWKTCISFKESRTNTISKQKELRVSNYVGSLF